MFGKLTAAAVAGLTTVSLAAGGHALAAERKGHHPSRPQGGHVEIILDRSSTRAGLAGMMTSLEAKGIEGLRIEQDGKRGFELELKANRAQDLRKELRQLKDLGIRPHIEQNAR